MGGDGARVVCLPARIQVTLTSTITLHLSLKLWKEAWCRFPPVRVSSGGSDSSTNVHRFLHRVLMLLYAGDMCVFNEASGGLYTLFVSLCFTKRETPPEPS